MARIGFHGFKSGTAVELALRKLGRKVQARTESWSDPEATEVSSDNWEEIPITADAEVTVHRSGMEVAPEMFMFKVSGYTGFDTPGPATPEKRDPRYSELYYLWDFDDPDGPLWTANARILSQHNNPNIAYGPTAAHTYTAPGTYNPSVIIYEPSSGKLAKVELGPYTVADPDVVFAGNRTTYINPTGDYTNAPAGANTRDNFNDYYFARTNEPHRIMIAAGTTVTRTAEIQPRSSSSNQFKNLYICGERGGERPIIDCRTLQDGQYCFHIIHASRDPSEHFDVTVDNVDFLAGWEADIETGQRNGLYRNGRQEFKDQPSYTLFHDCHASGFGIFFYTFTVDGDGLTFGLSNTSLTNWQDLAVFGSVNRMAHLGASVCQDPNAFSGGNKYQPFNVHGPVRHAGGDYCVVDGSDYFVCTGWTQNGRGYHIEQPCWRWNFTGNATGAQLNMQRTICEGGAAILALGHMNDYTIIVDTDILVDKCYLLGSYQTDTVVGVQFGGTTLRNNVMVFPDTKRLPGSVPQKFVNLNNPGTVTGTEHSKIVYEHNTYINLISEANIDRTDWEGIPDFVQVKPVAEGTVVRRNNVLHQPNLATPDVPFAPLDMTPAFEPFSLGYKHSDKGTFKFTQAEADAANAAGFYDIPFPTRDFHGDLYDPPLAQGDFANGNHFFGDGNDDAVNGPKGGKVTISFTASAMRITLAGTYQFKVNSTYNWKMDRNQGPRPIQKDTSYATSADSVILCAPLEGSLALGAGSEDGNVVDDFFGKRRPAYPSCGATEISQ